MNDQFQALAGPLRDEADRVDFSHLTEAAVARAARRRRGTWLRTRAAAVAAGLVLGLTSLGGAAYAADGAVPGDTFYWLDRLAENVGIGNGGASERFAEVQTLVDHGRPALGIEHAAATLIGMSEGAAEAREALLAAADRVATIEDLDDELSPPEGVADLLTYLSENAGAVDGRTVAEIARQIGPHPGGRPDDLPGNAPVTPGNPQGGPPDGAPPSGPYGPPEDFDPPPTTTISP